MADLAERATLKLPPVQPRQRGSAPPGGRSVVVLAAGCALLCLGVVLVHGAADVLPDEPIVSVLTPLRLVVVVGLVAVVVTLRSPLRLRSPLDLAVVAMLVAATVATVTSGQDWSGWRGVLTTVAVFYLAVGVRRSVLGSPTAIGLLVLVAVAVAGIVAMRQFSAGTATGFCRGALNSLDDTCGPGALIRVVATFANPNLLAAFLVLLLPLAAYGSAWLGDRASRLLGTGVVVFGYVAVVLTGSRAGVLGAVAGAGAVVVLRRPTARRLLSAALALAAMAALFVVAAGGSLGVREDVWAAAVRVVAAHPLGVGPGEGGALIAAEVPGEEAVQHAHNMWLHFAVEYGVLGLAATLAVTALAAIGAVLLARRGSGAAAALGAGLAGYAVVALFDHPANAVRMSVVLWLVLGLLAAEFRPEFGRIMLRGPAPAAVRHLGPERTYQRRVPARTRPVGSGRSAVLDRPVG